MKGEPAPGSQEEQLKMTPNQQYIQQAMAPPKSQKPQAVKEENEGEALEEEEVEAEEEMEESDGSEKLVLIQSI